MKRLTLTLVIGSVLIASSANAQEPAGSKPMNEKEFGNPGTLNFGAVTSLNFSYESASPPQGSSTSAIAFGLEPQIQYFIAEGFSVGGTALVNIIKPKDGDSITTFGIGPAAGYNLWLTPGMLSLWPQLEVLFSSTSSTATTSSTTGPTTTTSFTTTKFTLGAWVPLLIHPVKHFHFGVGPYFNIDLSSKQSTGDVSADGTKLTVFGIKGEIAGWL